MSGRVSIGSGGDRLVDLRRARASRGRPGRAAGCGPGAGCPGRGRSRTSGRARRRRSRPRIRAAPRPSRAGRRDLRASPGWRRTVVHRRRGPRRARSGVRSSIRSRSVSKRSSASRMKSNSSATVGRSSGEGDDLGRAAGPIDRMGTTAARSQRRVSVIGGLYRPPGAVRLTSRCVGAYISWCDISKDGIPSADTGGLMPSTRPSPSSPSSAGPVLALAPGDHGRGRPGGARHAHGTSSTPRARRSAGVQLTQDRTRRRPRQRPGRRHVARAARDPYPRRRSCVRADLRERRAATTTRWRHQHGLDNPNGPHAGDLPNLIVNADGRGRLDAGPTGSP